MKLRDLYEKALKSGIKADPRNPGAVKSDLKNNREAYRDAKGIDKQTFDTESLENPYADSRILFGTGEEKIKNVLVGIDIDVQEILLADRLADKGQKIDLVISHHPSGRAYAGLGDVLALQPGIWERIGFDKDIARGVMKDRQNEVMRGVLPRNHMRAVDSAKLLGIPFICLHTVADNCVAEYLQKAFDKKNGLKLGGIINFLKSIPEYKHSIKVCGVGPEILAGESNDKAGRIFVDMTGGTNGPDRMMPRLSQSGVRTIVGMHIKESGLKSAKREFINYIAAGHTASDNLGLNLLFDSIDGGGELNFVECSGFKRFRRLSK